MSKMIKLTVEHEGKSYDLWQGTDEEKRVLDLDLARWAGQKNPSSIGEMLSRYETDLKDLGFLARAEKPSSAVGGRPRTATYLNEPQALFLLAKMETPRAKAALKALIAVYMMAKTGRAGGEQLRALQEEVQQLRAQVRVLVRSLPSARTLEEQEIRDTIGFPRDQPLRLLSVYLYPRLQQELHRRERRASQDAERVGMGKQGKFKGVP